MRNVSRWIELSAAGMALLAAVACSGGDDGNGGDDDTGAGADAGADGATADTQADGSGEADSVTDTTPMEPTFPELEAGWNLFEPGGDTICSQGTPFRFWARPGTVNRLVVEFEGGGACWNALTCGGNGFYDATIGPNDMAGNTGGIYDTENEENPFRDWWHVFIPYCTADVHWGNNTVEYSDSLTIEHRGYTNVSTVLAWVFEEFSAPEKVFVTGCSAGSYGSIMYAPYVARQYPNARIYHLGDSGAGVITETFQRTNFPNWDPTDAFPAWIDGLDPEEMDYRGLPVATLYERIAGAYPNATFSQYNVLEDGTQMQFFTVMGGDATEWAGIMRQSMDDIEGAVDNFYYYLAPGDVHCIIPSNLMYTMEVNDVRFVDWLGAMVNDEPFDTVRAQ